MAFRQSIIEPNPFSGPDAEVSCGVRDWDEGVERKGIARKVMKSEPG